MAGIYIHIPFCKQACTYCDFHFSTSSKLQGPLVEAIKQEIISRKDDIQSDINTIYFGGGSPSILASDELASILDVIKTSFTIKSDAEITLESNPDDHRPEQLENWKDLGINRLSIGIQSFDDDVLKWMNRAHSAEEASTCVKAAQGAGFDNITADLIYGIPDKTMSYWENQLEQMLALKVQHISAYCLTSEPKTALAHQINKGDISLPDEQLSSDQFLRMRELFMQHGFEHYEVSNFGLPGYHSKHNSAYWQGVEYLGIGPSAHSYIGGKRRWNISNNPKYMAGIKNNEHYWDEEILSPASQYNELVMTGLRTSWGINKQQIQNLDPAFLEHLEQHLLPYDTFIQTSDTHIKLTPEGLLMADHIAADVFIVD